MGKGHSMGTVVAGVGEDKGQGDETSNRNEKKQVMVILLLVLPRILRILTLCPLVICRVDRDTSGEYVILRLREMCDYIHKIIATDKKGYF